MLSVRRVWNRCLCVYAPRLLVVCLSLAPLTCLSAEDEDISAKYPGLAEAERPAIRSADCRDLRANLKGLPDDLDRRVDLWVSGTMTAIQTDGALWYVSLCLAPDIKVLCVTYQPNDLKIGDHIFARGAYMRPDNDHIMLDPCLASTSEQDDNSAPADK